MENSFRNEMEITIGGEKILLRPTFENVAAMETKIGGLPFIAWKFMQMGKPSEAMPSLSDCAMIIYCNQVNGVNGQKPHSLDKIWELVQSEGLRVIAPVTIFLSKITAGNAMANTPSETEKKS